MEEEYDGEFSDLQGDELDGYDEEDFGEEEGLGELDEEDELLQMGSEFRTEKAKQVAEKENIEVTERFFDKLVGQLERKPGYGSLKLFLQVFVDLLNDETKDKLRKKAYTITDIQLLNRVMKYGVEQFPAILAASSGLE
jgi:hypothetical protein